jgi:hypothetical protein
MLCATGHGSVTDVNHGLTSAARCEDAITYHCLWVMKSVSPAFRDFTVSYVISSCATMVSTAVTNELVMIPVVGGMICPMSTLQPRTS